MFDTESFVGGTYGYPEEMNLRRPIIGVAMVGLALLIIFGIRIALRTPDSQTTELLLSSDSSTLSDMQDLRRVTQEIASTQLIMSEELSGRFEAALAGKFPMDEFILELLAKAEDGDADSAYYVSEAMKFCAADLVVSQISVDKYRPQAISSNPSSDEAIAFVMDGLVGNSEFYLKEARRHLDRAVECMRLGWNSQTMYEFAVDWGATAEELGQPIAVAKLASLDPDDPPSDLAELEQSRATMRDIVRNNKNLRVFLYASTVTSTVTGIDHTLDKLSWALLACEYASCDDLNHLYRGVCEVMSLQGSDVCTTDMNDIDYLFRKYPEYFDAAQVRAAELKEAIETENWQSIGL